MKLFRASLSNQYEIQLSYLSKESVHGVVMFLGLGGRVYSYMHLCILVFYWGIAVVMPCNQSGVSLCRSDCVLVCEAQSACIAC